MYSPLLKAPAHPGAKRFVPIVDSLGTVVGYMGQVHYKSLIVPSKMERAGRNEQFYAAIWDPKHRVAVRSGEKWFNPTGGFYYLAALDLNGQIVFYRTDEPGLESVDIVADIILAVVSMGAHTAFKAGVGVAIKAGQKMLVRKTLSAAGLMSAGRRVLNVGMGVLKRATRTGKFVKGGAQKITLRHGTTKANKASIKKNGLRKTGSGVTDDLGDGVYMTTDDKVADASSKTRSASGGAGGKQMDSAVIEVEIEASKLGKIVDIREGGMHRQLWEEFLEEPIIKGSSMTHGKAIEHNMNRGEEFMKFIRKNGLEEFDTAIAPLGDKYTSGILAIPGRISDQIVIRSDRVLQTINKIIMSQ
jgi:hypothetical protein